MVPSSITVLPFDHALGPPSPLARRIARNTQLVLLEESSVGRVIDPAGGAWFVERLTEEMAERAWSLVQEVERRGGMLPALIAGLAAAAGGGEPRAAGTRGGVPTRCQSPACPSSPTSGPRRRRSRKLAAPTAAPRRSGRFLRFASPPASSGCERSAMTRCPRWRTADACSWRPWASEPEFAGRETFARNLFEAGGFAAPACGELGVRRGGRPRVRASGARQAAICSSDSVYGDSAAAAAHALKDAGAAAIYLMGRPSDAQRAAWSAAGVDEFVSSRLRCAVACSSARMHARPEAWHDRNSQLCRRAARRARARSGRWAEAFRAETGHAPDEVAWTTPEGIAVPPLYTAADTAGLDFLGTWPGLPPFLRGPYPTMYATQPWTIRQYAGLLHGRGQQRLLPAQPRGRAEGPVGRLRPRHPPRLRQRPPARRRRRRHGRRRDRLDPRHARSCSTASRSTR